MLEIPVRFSECDLYGVVWHGRYAIYFEEVRNAITARYGWTVARAREHGFRVPVTRMEIDYKAPALLDSRLRVTARLRPPRIARLVFDYEIRDTGGRILTRAVTEQVVTRESSELLLTLPAFLSKLADDIQRGQDDAVARILS